MMNAKFNQQWFSHSHENWLAKKRLDEPALAAGPKSLLTEFGYHHRQLGELITSKQLMNFEAEN